jgi:hypothetical protein
MFEPRGSFNDSRFEFERKFHILIELMIDGRMKFSSQARMSADSLTKIRKLPNGRIDLNTVDEMARTSANMAGNMEDIIKQNNFIKREG